MRNKSFIKRIMAVALSLIVVLGIMTTTVFADGTYTFPSLSQSGNNNSTLRYYLTDENAGDVNITQESGYVQLRLVLDDGWYFDKWETYFNGYEDVAIFSDPEVKGSNPKSDDGYYTFFNTNGLQSPFVNHSGSRNAWINIAKVTGFYGDHSVTAVLKPIVTVNADEGVSYQVATNNPSYTNLAVNQVAVKYGDNATITYTVDDKYIVTNVSANYGTNYSDNGTAVTVNSIIKPVTVTINTRLKQHNVIFDANGGEGTMSAQVFEHSVAQTLTENSFTKVGYTFAGWNTLANGDGISYSNKQAVTFTPANDGDSITLYAQWTECSNHIWNDGKCTECGICSHTGGTPTCTEQAVCGICGEKYGDLAKHNVVYNSSGNVITETCTNGCNHSATATVNAPIGTPVYDGTEKKAAVFYSDGWQGGELAITYEPGNTDAGSVTATITKDGKTASVNYTIYKVEPTYTVPTGLTATYGDALADVTLPEGWSWKDSTASVGDAGTNTFKAIFTPASTDNYKTVETNVSVKVEPKEIGINWGTTEFTYSEGKAQAPTATVTETAFGDRLTLTVDGAKVDAGSYTATVTGITGDKAANYKLPSNVTTAFTIGNASQTAPVVTGVNETISAKADGKITGVNSTMEYRMDGESVYTAISGPELTDLAEGKYYVRYAAKTNYNASADTEVVIGAGRKLTVTLPAEQIGYELKTSATELDWHGGTTLTFTLKEGYEKSAAFAIKINGDKVELDDHGICPISDIDKDLVITVEGVVLKTYTVTYTDENGIVKTVEVEHGKDATLPTVPAKDGYTGKWDHDGKNITADTVINAIYTETVPAPSDSQSPQTGDNSNMALWIALLFISGSALIMLTVYDRKRRTALGK